MTIFDQYAQNAVVRALENVYAEASTLREITVLPDVVSFVRQDDEDAAIVVHLLPSGEHDVLVLGVPSKEAREAVSLVCLSIAREFMRIKQATKAPVFAQYDVWR